MTFSNILIGLFLITICSFFLYYIIRSKRKTKNYEYLKDNIPKPVKMGKYDIYLRDDELKVWNSYSRQYKRKVAQKYIAAIKKGELYPVEQPDGTVLYATKVK